MQCIVHYLYMSLNFYYLLIMVVCLKIKSTTFQLQNLARIALSKFTALQKRTTIKIVNVAECEVIVNIKIRLILNVQSIKTIFIQTELGSFVAVHSKIALFCAKLSRSERRKFSSSAINFHKPNRRLIECMLINMCEICESKCGNRESHVHE